MTNGSMGEKKLIINVVWKFAERIVAQLVSLIVSIVLARLLLPEDYGAISMVTVFISIAYVFVTEGIPKALIQKINAEEVDFSSVFYFNLMISCIIYSVLFFIAPYVAGFYNMPILSSVIRVMGLSIIIASINSVQHAYVSKHMLFKKYFWSTLLGTLVSGIIGIIMAYQGYGVWALVAQYMINTFIDTIVLFITVSWRPCLLFNFIRIKELIKFGWKMLFEGVASMSMEQLQNMIIGRVYFPSDLAYYTKGQQFPALIVSNISISIGSVLFPALSNEQNDKEKVLQILRKSLKLSYYIVFPLLTGLFVLARPFILIILTDKWLDAVFYLKFFCLIYAPDVALVPRHQALNAIGRSDVYMVEHIVVRIFQIIALIALYKISVKAIAVCVFVGRLFAMVVVAYTSYKYNGYLLRQQMKDIIPSVCGCVIMGVLVAFVGRVGCACRYIFILQVLVGIVAYILYSIIFRLNEYDVCKKYIGLVCGKIKGFFQRNSSIR